MIHLDYRDSRPIYIQIVEGFKEQIQAGVLEAGERLPSVRELAFQLTINPNTIQRAYRELETGGWIASVPGKGSFVCTLAERKNLVSPQLQAFDDLVRELEKQGIARSTLIERLQGGK